MAEESLMEREDYEVTKTKIIKTNDLLHMYQMKTDKLNKASQAFKQLKSKHQSACQEAERLKLEKEQLNDGVSKYKTDLEQTSNNFAKLQCEYRSLEAKYEENLIQSQMTITELEEKVNQCLSNKNRTPSSPGKKNAEDRLRELKKSYSDLRDAEHQKTVENKALLKEINQLKDAAAKKVAKMVIKDSKELNALKDQLQKANATIQEQNRLNSIEKLHKENSETEVAKLKSQISVLEDKCRCLTELLNSAKNRDIDRCDIFTQTEFSLPQAAKSVTSPPQVRHCVIDSDEFESLMELSRLPLLSPIRSDSSDSPNTLSKKNPRKFRYKKKLQCKFNEKTPPAPPAPRVESIENVGGNIQNTLVNQGSTNTIKRIPGTKVFALCAEEEKRSSSNVKHNPASKSISSKTDQFVQANVNNLSGAKGDVSDIWSIIDGFDRKNQIFSPPNNQIPIEDMIAPLMTQGNIDSLNIDTSSASGIKSKATCPSVNIPLLKRDEKNAPEYTARGSKGYSFRETSSSPLPAAESANQQAKRHKKAKWPVKAKQRRKFLMPSNTTRLLRARVPNWRQFREIANLQTGDTILSALQLLKANNISFTISSDSIQPFPSLMITPPKTEISTDFQSHCKPFQCRTVCLDKKCTQNGMMLREASQDEEPELLGFFHVKDEATSSAAATTESQLSDPVKQLAEQLLNVLKEMNVSKKKQMRKGYKPRRSTSSDGHSKYEFDLLCDAPSVLQRNKRLLAEARWQSNRLNDDTGRESDIDEFLDSGLVTATTKHDTDSQSLFSYNEDEVLTRNFRSSSVKSDVKPLRKNDRFSYSRALAARRSTNTPTSKNIDEDTLPAICKSNSLLPELSINTVDLECLHVDMKSEVMNGFRGLNGSLDGPSEPEDQFGRNDAKTNIESKVLNWELSPVGLKTAEEPSGLNTSLDELNLANSFIKNDTVKGIRKRKMQNVFEKTRMEWKVDLSEPSINCLHTCLDESNEEDRWIGQNGHKKQKLIEKINAEHKVDGPKPSVNNLHLEGLPGESKVAEVNNYFSSLDTSMDKLNETDSFIEKEHVKINNKRKKQSIIAKICPDGPESVNILNRNSCSVDLKSVEINSSFISLETSLDESNEADNLSGQNERKKQKVNEKIDLESKVDSPKPTINTLHLEELPLESKTAGVNNYFSCLDTSFNELNEADSFMDKNNVKIKIDNSINALNRSWSSEDLKLAEINSSFNSLNTSLDEPSEGTSFIESKVDSSKPSISNFLLEGLPVESKTAKVKNSDLDTSLDEPNEIVSLTGNKKINASTESGFVSPRTRSQVKKSSLVKSPSTRVIQIRNKNIQVEPKIEKPKNANQRKSPRNASIGSKESDEEFDHIVQVTISEKNNQSCNPIKKKPKIVRNTIAKSNRITRSSSKIISKEYVSGSSSDCSVQDETVDSRACLPENRLNTELNQEKEISKSLPDFSSKLKHNISASVNKTYDTNHLFGSDSSDEDSTALKLESLLKEDLTASKEVPFTENTNIDRVDESKQEVSCEVNITNVDNAILNEFNRTVEENLKTKTWSHNAQTQQDEIADQEELQRSLKRNFDEFKTRYKNLKPKSFKNDVNISLGEKSELGVVPSIVNDQYQQPAVSDSTLNLDESSSSSPQENRENTEVNSKINILQDIAVYGKATPLRKTLYCEEKCGHSDAPVQQNKSTSDLIDYSDMMSDDCLTNVNLETEKMDAESLNSDQNPPPSKSKVMNRKEILDTMNRLIMFSEDVEVFNEAAQKFSNQTVDFVAFVFLEKLCHDIFDKPNNDCPPSPVMTTTQRILLGFLTKLDNTTHKGILNKFLDVADVQLFKKPHDAKTIEPVTRVYTAICRMQLNINRMRRFICESFYFTEENANSILFIVLTMWGNVMPMAADLAKYPLAKVIIQLCYTQKKAVPQIMPLRDLLQKYFGYPADPWNADELFEELLENYIKNPFERQSDFPILLFFKNQPAKWVFQKIKKPLMLLFQRIPSTNSNLRANLIIFMGNICNAFQAHVDEEWLFILEMNQWFETIQKAEEDAVVQKSLILAKNRLPVRRPVRAKKGNKSVKNNQTPVAAQKCSVDQCK